MFMTPCERLQTIRGVVLLPPGELQLRTSFALGGAEPAAISGNTS